VFACTGLAEERIESIIATAYGLVTGHLSVRLDTMLQTEELPARVTNLDTTLTKVKAENLAHDCKDKEGL